MEYLYILDYNTCNIYEILLDNKDIDIIDILKKYNLREDECCYMFSPIKLKIKTLK